MDFVKISYTGKIKDGGVFYTTSEETAKKEGIYDEKRVYRPMPVIVGEGQLVSGLDEALRDMNPGEAKTVEVPPEKGYGMRDPSLVRLVPIKIFKKQNINPMPGMPVELDGRPARVQTVAGGRVRVDFNPEFAGKTLIFDVKVGEKAATEEDKVRFLVERSFNEPANFGVKLSGKKLEVGIPEEAFHDRNILARKASLAAEAFRYLKLENITFTETWTNPEMKKSEKKPEEKK